MNLSYNETLRTNSSTEIPSMIRNLTANFVTFSWLDYLGFFLEGCILTFNCLTNGFIALVLGKLSDRSHFDVLQFHLALWDMVFGTVGVLAVVTSRCLMQQVSLKGFSCIIFGVMFIVANNSFESLSEMLVTLLRTKQVKYSSKFEHVKT